MYRTAPGIRSEMILSSLLFRISASARYVINTSLLGQAPDLLMQHEYPPKIRFSNLRVLRVKRYNSCRVIRAALSPGACLEGALGGTGPPQNMLAPLVPPQQRRLFRV